MAYPQRHTTEETRPVETVISSDWLRSVTVRDESVPYVNWSRISFGRKKKICGEAEAAGADNGADTPLCEEIRTCRIIAHRAVFKTQSNIYNIF